MIELRCACYLAPDSFSLPAGVMDTKKIRPAVDLDGYLMSADLIAAVNIVLGEEQECRVILPYGEVFRSRVQVQKTCKLFRGKDEIGYVRFLEILKVENQATYDSAERGIRNLEADEDVTEPPIDNPNFRSENS